MKKKLMVIPMKGQYEQLCNAAALKEMGVPVIKSLKVGNIEKIMHWVEAGTHVEVDYPDNTEAIINQILAIQTEIATVEPQVEVKKYSVKKFRNLVLKKIVAQL
jgi:hypothetical protein